MLPSAAPVVRGGVLDEGIVAGIVLAVVVDGAEALEMRLATMSGVNAGASVLG